MSISCGCYFAGNGQLDFKLAAAQNPLFNKHKTELEHIVAHTRFTPRR